MAHTNFEWDPKKDAENQRKHGISFSRAQYAFLDPQRVIARDSAIAKQRSDSTALERLMVACLLCGLLIVPQSFALLALVIGAKEKPFMSRKIKYTDEPLGEVEVVADFLPLPTEFVLRKEEMKVIGQALGYKKKGVKQVAQASFSQHNPDEVKQNPA